MSKPSDIVWHHGVRRTDRMRHLGQHGATLWFTGLSGSGKSTLAAALEQALLEKGVMAYRLDGDNVRHGLNRDLGFDAESRVENIRRIAEVAKLFTDATCLTLVSFISPYRADREAARQLHEAAGLAFAEIHIDCSLEEAERRDPKGLYQKARAGEIKNFTGIHAPYELPVDPDLKVDTTSMSVDEAVKALMAMLQQRQWMAPS